MPLAFLPCQQITKRSKTQLTDIYIDKGAERKSYQRGYAHRERGEEFRFEGNRPEVWGEEKRPSVKIVGGVKRKPKLKR